MPQATITAWEVVQYSPAGRSYPTTQICNNILTVEEAFFYRCFGQDFYDYMQAHLNPYPDPEPGEWSAAAAYAAGDFAVYNGCLYESLTNANTGNNPVTETTDWQPAERFDTDCLNNLWTAYLRPYLAHVLYAESLLPTTHQSGGGGVVIRENARNGGQGEGVRTGNMAEISALKASALDKAARIYENMVRWLSLNLETCTEFQNIAVCAGACAPAERKSSRAIAWRN